MTVHEQLIDLDKAECLQLLSTVPFGRVVYTRDALPAVRLVNHLLIDGELVMAADLELPGRLASVGTVIAYQTDQLDPDRQAGWSVTVLGRAFRASEALSRHYYAVRQPWLDAAASQVIAIRTELVKGFRLLPALAPLAAGNRATAQPDDSRRG